MKFCFLSPIGYKTPMLFDTFVPTFVEHGHQIVKNVKEANIVFLDLHSRIGDYDLIDISYIAFLNKPVCFFDFWDYGGMSKESWPYLPTQKYFGFGLINLIENYCKNIWFIRKMDVTINYPSYCYPLELCEYPDHNFGLTSKEELFSRPYDCCFIGAPSPQRRAFCKSLETGGIKINYMWSETRMPHDVWLNHYRNAKFFIESDGGGFGSERPYQLMTIAPMLKQRNNQLILNDWVDLSDCIKIGDKDGYVNEDEISGLKKVLNEQELLYEIYLRGNVRMKKYFNFNYRAEYILGVLEKEGLCQK